MTNMSENGSDGFVLAYIKDGVMYPALVSDENLQMLDITIGLTVGEFAIAENNPFGKVHMERLKK